MLKNITIGQYFPGNSFVHRLDPRTKLLLTVALIVAVFLCDGFLGFVAVFAYVLLAARMSKIKVIRRS